MDCLRGEPGRRRRCDAGDGPTGTQLQHARCRHPLLVPLPHNTPFAAAPLLPSEPSPAPPPPPPPFPPPLACPRVPGVGPCCMGSHVAPDRPAAHGRLQPHAQHRGREAAVLAARAEPRWDRAAHAGHAVSAGHAAPTPRRRASCTTRPRGCRRRFTASPPPPTWFFLAPCLLPTELCPLLHPRLTCRPCNATRHRPLDSPPSTVPPAPAPFLTRLCTSPWQQRLRRKAPPPQPRHALPPPAPACSRQAGVPLAPLVYTLFRCPSSHDAVPACDGGRPLLYNERAPSPARPACFLPSSAPPHPPCSCSPL